MNRCIGCYGEFTEDPDNNDRKDHKDDESTICKSCLNNKFVIISEREAMGLYKIPYKIISSVKFTKLPFHFNSYSRNILREEVHNLANNLCKNLPKNDKRKKAFLEQDEIFKKNNIGVLRRKNMIINNLNEFTKKLSNPIAFTSDPIVINLINQYALNDKMVPYTAAVVIMAYLEQNDVSRSSISVPSH